MYNRVVFLRFAPEMQGQWFPRYGFMPSLYVPMWRRMYTTLKAIVPNVIIVWAPNMGNGYPYGQTPDASELALLDTNGDGRVTSADDPYTPFYPGDEYVDWIGISVYYKSRSSDGLDMNLVQSPDFCGSARASSLQPAALMLSHRTRRRDWATVLHQLLRHVLHAFSAHRVHVRRCATSTAAPLTRVPESAAAWHAWPNVTALSTVTQAELMGGWIRGCMLNATLYDSTRVVPPLSLIRAAFPRLKMIMVMKWRIRFG